MSMSLQDSVHVDDTPNSNKNLSFMVNEQQTEKIDIATMRVSNGFTNDHRCERHASRAP